MEIYHWVFCIVKNGGHKHVKHKNGGHKYVNSLTQVSTENTRYSICVFHFHWSYDPVSVFIICNYLEIFTVKQSDLWPV